MEGSSSFDPPAGEDDDTKTGDDSAAETETTPAATAKTVKYEVFSEMKLDLGSAAARKEAAEQLEKLAVEGSLTVLARVGRASSKTPKGALEELGQHRELDGDYEVISNNARTQFNGVKTSTRVRVSIG